jgi:hypothetical protein
VAVETARRIRLLIADEWVDGSGDPLALTSPATGKEIAAVEQGTRAHRTAFGCFANAGQRNSSRGSSTKRATCGSARPSMRRRRWGR